MIERNGSEIELLCDRCLAPFEAAYDAADFQIMIIDAKAAGWRVLMIKPGEFEHICVDCDASTNKRRRRG